MLKGSRGVSEGDRGLTEQVSSCFCGFGPDGQRSEEQGVQGGREAGISYSSWRDGRTLQGPQQWLQLIRLRGRRLGGTRWWRRQSKIVTSRLNCRRKYILCWALRVHLNC